MRAEPVKYSVGPWLEEIDPLRVMLIFCESRLEMPRVAFVVEGAFCVLAWLHAEASQKSDATKAPSIFVFSTCSFIFFSFWFRN
jgi:hypothetical protein